MLDFENIVQNRITRLNQEKYCEQVWRKNALLWKPTTQDVMIISKSLGWLDVAEKMQDSLGELFELLQEVKKEKFTHVLHMGMGGSSLAALVYTDLCGSERGLPLTVLDTTDPAAIQTIESTLNIESTLFIVASKSGTTIEALAFKDYFYEKLVHLKGHNAGKNFIAITDPETPLAQRAKDENFRRLFLNPPDIGGRYSALSYFGLVPAVLAGADVKTILERSIKTIHTTKLSSEKESTALMLGAVLGEMAVQKKNKMTFLADTSLHSLALWIEQLVAESTGKENKGLIPIIDEPVSDLASYGDDRFFIFLKLKGTENQRLQKFALELQQAGYFVLTLEMKDIYDLGEQFFQWEFATAVASSIMGINAFDQPNVEESKKITNLILNKTEAPTSKIPVVLDMESSSGTDLLKPFLAGIQSDDYLAIMVFLAESEKLTHLLQTLRQKIHDKYGVATTLGYGPRFLHSTGQLHKGGPDNGVFMQITADDKQDLPIPGRNYSFGDLKKAQAQGDLLALAQHTDRILRVHLGKNIEQNLEALLTILDER